MPSSSENVISNKHVGGRGRGTPISWTNYRDGKQMRKKREEEIKNRNAYARLPVEYERRNTLIVRPLYIGHP